MLRHITLGVVSTLTLTLHAAPGAISYVGGVGGNGSTPFAINDAGVVVGRSYDTSGWWHLFRYAPGGPVEDLGMYGNGNGHTAGYGINNSGTIVGGGGGDSGYSGYEAFQFNPGATFVSLGDLEGFTYSASAHSINDAGVIVGHADGPSGSARAFRKTPTGPMENLGTLGGTRSHARDINASGVIVGDSNGHAFRYDGNGPMTDLGALTPDSDSFAEGINLLGTIVGYGIFPLDPRTSGGRLSEQRPLRWDASGQIEELALFAGWIDGRANAINDTGISVGQALSPAGQRAILWQADGTAVDLDAWLDATNPSAGAYWTLQGAFDINSSGQVVGYGQYNDGPAGLPDGGYGFVLDASAVPEPAAAGLIIAASAMLTAARPRRRA